MPERFASTRVGSSLAAVVFVTLPPVVSDERVGAKAPPGSRQQETAADSLADPDYVEVTARVTDAAGRFVGTLRKEDFRLTEGGRLQAITTFDVVTLPAVDPEAGGIYALLVDDLLIEPALTPVVRDIARAFLERVVRTGDRVAVVTTSDASSAAQPLISDPAALRTRIDRVVGRRTDPPHLSRREDTLRLLAVAASRLATIDRRRKAIVLVSQDPPHLEETAPDLRDATRTVLAAATRRNVAIYAVDPGGLPAGRALGPIGDAADGDWRVDAMRALSSATGGFAVANSNDLGAAFDRIRDDNTAYYVLGYRSEAGGRGGRRRDVDVPTPVAGLRVSLRVKSVTPPPVVSAK